MYEARDLELRALMAPSDLPPELQMQPVDYEMIRKAQEEDPECSGLRAKLQSGDKRVAAQFEDVDGMLFKVSHADDADTTTLFLATALMMVYTASLRALLLVVLSLSSTSEPNLLVRL